MDTYRGPLYYALLVLAYFFCALVDYLLFIFCMRVVLMDALLSFCLSFAVALLFLFAFRSLFYKAEKKRFAYSDYSVFLAVNAVLAIIGVAAIYLFSDRTATSPLIIKTVMVIIAFVANIICQFRQTLPPRFLQKE